MILAADIGGTKSMLGLYKGDSLVCERRFENENYTNFNDIVRAFLDTCAVDHASVQVACLAAAGPMADDGCSIRLTNLVWPEVSVAAIRSLLPRAAVRVVNDFVAAAMGAVSSSSAQLVTLQSGLELADSPRVVLGAGTGLGLTIVLREGNNWRMVPSEAGHIAFGPADDEQVELLRFLRGIYGRVTWERVVSGPGLSDMHRFVSASIEALEPHEITQIGQVQAQSLAALSLQLFARCYGAFAGDMALAVLARGGVYLAGGIAAKMLPVLQAGGFVAAFNDKAGHSDITLRVPIHVTTDSQMGLRGAFLLARDMVA